MKQSHSSPSPVAATTPAPASPQGVPGRWMAVGVVFAVLLGAQWLPLDGSAIDTDGEGNWSTPIASPEERSPSLPRSVVRYLASLDEAPHVRR